MSSEIYDLMALVEYLLKDVNPFDKYADTGRPKSNWWGVRRKRLVSNSKIVVSAALVSKLFHEFVKHPRRRYAITSGQRVPDGLVSNDSAKDSNTTQHNESIDCQV